MLTRRKPNGIEWMCLVRVWPSKGSEKEKEDGNLMPVHYWWTLSKVWNDDGIFKDCWMVDGVIPDR
eukprot:4297869-Ditylum_brightwellii.AAC.1